MATSQDLVPTGGAYGDRQRNVAAMQQAGVPTSSAGGPPGRSAPPATSAPRAVPSPGGAGGFDPLSLLTEHAPDEFPFIGASQPSPAEGEPDSVIGALASSAQSTFGLAVLARLAHNRGR